MSGGIVLPIAWNMLEPTKMMPDATKFHDTMRRYSSPDGDDLRIVREDSDQRSRRDVADGGEDQHHAAGHATPPT